MTKKELEGKILEITRGENLVSRRTLKKIDELPYIELEHCGISGTGKGMLWVAYYVGDGERDEVCELIEVQNLEWKELALENEDKIKEAMREAFRASIGTIKDSFRYAVVLDYDGDVRTCLLSQNETPMDVFYGNATVVAEWERDTLENIDWNLYEWLTTEEQAAFEKWMDENDYDPAWPSDADIKEWNAEIYERAYAEREEDFFDTHLEDNIMDAWDRFFMDLDWSWT
jgi:hypothetical protein